MGYALAATWRSVAPEVAGPRPLDWPPGHEPGGLDSDAATGRLYATDRTSDTVRVYDAAGVLEQVLGGSGDQPGELRAPRDVAVLPDGTLIVSDTGNDRVQHLGADGAPLGHWPVADPRGVVVHDGPDGAYSYVVSGGDRRIYRFDAQGALSTAGDLTHTLRLETLGAPDGLDSLGFTYYVQGQPAEGFVVADREAGTVRLVPETTFSAQPYNGVRAPGIEAVALGPVDRTRTPGGRIYELGGAPSAGVLALYRHPLVPQLPFPESTLPFARVSDLAVAPSGTLYAAAEPGGVLDLGSAVALYRALIDSFGRILQPARIAAGDALFVGDALPRVHVWSRAGAPLHDVPLPRGVPDAFWPAYAPLDMAAYGDRAAVLDGEHRLWLLEEGRLGARRAPFGAVDAIPVAASANGDGLAVLDILEPSVVLLDWQLEEVGRWSLATAETAGYGDLALGADRVLLVDRAAALLDVRALDGTRIARRRLPSPPLRVAAGPDGSAYVLTASGWILRYGRDDTPLGAWSALGDGAVPTDLVVGDEGRVYVTDATGAVRAFDPAPGVAAALPPAADDASCAMVPDKRAAPEVLDLGETVGIELVLDGTCPGQRQPVDLVLAFDVSGSMREEHRLLAAKQAALALLGYLDPWLTRVGIVTFESAAHRRLALTFDRRATLRAVIGLETGGGTNLAEGFALAADELSGGIARPGAARAMIMLSDGFASPPSAAVIDAARAAGITVFAVGLGTADAAVLRSIASSPAHAFTSPTSSDLQSIFERIGRRLAHPVLLESVTIVDELPDDMAYVPDSGWPVQPALSPDGRELRWTLRDIPAPGLRLGYRVQPTRTGRRPTNIAATAAFTDGLGIAGSAAFPVPAVQVRGPTPTRLYLPLALGERCAPGRPRLAVALALDVSSSMRQETAGGRSKLAAAQEAIRAFLDQLALGGREGDDLAALVPFHATASLAQPLTSDRRLLDAALDRLDTAEGTRIDRGIALGFESLVDARPAGASAVLVVLSDGQSAPDAAADAIAVAAAVRDAGIALYAIGLGTDADAEHLGSLAGRSDRYLHAPDGAELARVYAELAAALVCPAADFWPRSAQGAGEGAAP